MKEENIEKGTENNDMNAQYRIYLLLFYLLMLFSYYYQRACKLRIASQQQNTENIS